MNTGSTAFSNSADPLGAPQRISVRQLRNWLPLLLICSAAPVDGGPKLRRGGLVAAVKYCSAQMCSLREWEAGGESRDLFQTCREAQECTLTWSFGLKSVAEF